MSSQTNGPIPHHISDVDTWGGHPDRSYFTFVILSILLGFFGLDHFYLRSFGTGTKKFLINIITLGTWYWWDIIQIVAEGGKVREKGLNSPLDWIRGIGRGVFVPPPVPKTEEQKAAEKKEEEKKEAEREAAKEAAKKEGKEYKEEDDDTKDYGFGADKSYLIYAFLAIFFGWLGADKFYMGELWQGLAKLISCFNIFLLLFGWLWVLWDSFHAFFLTSDILKDGIGVPLPYTLLFSHVIPGSKFKIRKLTKEDVENAKFKIKPGSFFLFSWFGAWFGAGSFAEFCNKWLNIQLPTLPVKEIYKEVVAPLMTVPILAALKAVGKPAPPQPSCLEDAMSMIPPMPPIPTAQEVHEAVISAADTGRSAVSIAAEPVAIMAKGVENATHRTESRAAFPPQPLPPLQMQTGGGSGSGSGPGPVIAGALTAVVLAGGLKGFYDMISKQYG
jgi:TM2 domain-containing membrane protein YozV